MGDWKRVLREGPTSWLLEESNPSVRYFVLTRLFGRADDDPEVVRTREAINQSQPVLKLLDAQRPEGYWDRDRRPYIGASKQLITLEFLGYSGDDPRVRAAIEYLYANAQMDDGALTAGELDQGRKGVIPCYTANAVHFLHWFGYGEDERTQRALSYLLQTQRDDGGWLCFERVKKTHACFWATAKVLRALEAVPADPQTSAVQETRDRAANLLLDNSLYRHHSEFGKVHPSWFQFARPLFASSDVLEVLELVAPFVSPDDERIQEGLQLVLEKQDSHGRWPAERSVRVRQSFPIPFEEEGQPSKWVTLSALSMLKKLYS